MRQGVSRGGGRRCTQWLWEGGEGMQMERQEKQQLSVTRGHGSGGEGGEDDSQGLP